MDEKVRKQARKAARDAFDAIDRWDAHPDWGAKLDAALEAYEAALEAAGYVFVPKDAAS